MVCRRWITLLLLVVVAAVLREELVLEDLEPALDFLLFRVLLTQSPLALAEQVEILLDLQPEPVAQILFFLPLHLMAVELVATLIIAPAFLVGLVVAEVAQITVVLRDLGDLGILQQLPHRKGTMVRQDLMVLLLCFLQ